MLDSIYAGNLPAGADAYLGYVDGNWADFQAEVARFPHAHVLSMAVFPRDDAVGCDREPGDLALGDIAVWVKRQIARGVWRPVVYASASNMGACIAALDSARIFRPDVRLLSAHYGAGKHICGSDTCGLVSVDMDGTQWRDNAPGAGGSLVDESVLLDDFFGAQPAPVPIRAAPVTVPVEEPGMILFNVDQSTVPAGDAWPGVLLLAGDATLHHVTSPADLNAYKAAGLKEATFSYGEFLELGGVTVPAP